LKENLEIHSRIEPKAVLRAAKTKGGRDKYLTEICEHRRKKKGKEETKWTGGVISIHGVSDS